MIDCSKTENYFAEKRRMTKRNKYVCTIDCADCPLSSSNNDINISCSSLETDYPDKAIEIVQRWSNEHPQKTYLTEFLKSYPKTELNSDGYPSDIVPCSLGLIKRKDICKNMCLYFYDNGHPCYDCWNTPKENEE